MAKTKIAECATTVTDVRCLDYY